MAGSEQGEVKVIALMATGQALHEVTPWKGACLFWYVCWNFLKSILHHHGGCCDSYNLTSVLGPSLLDMDPSPLE